jgi:hypothetical protein
MPSTDDMSLLMNRLRSDAPTQAAFRQDPAQAVAGYNLTTHERDAIVTKDCSDLVALGFASNSAGLPDVLDCPQISRPGNAPGIIDRIRDVVRPIRDRLPIPDRIPLPPFGRRPTPPRPEPRPEPPRPRPTPGPDPPGPDRPGGGG